MLESKITRRNFLKLGGAAAGAVTAAQFVPPPLAQAARPLISDPNGDGYIPTMCEMCVWRCGVRAKVKDGRIPIPTENILRNSARAKSKKH